MSISIYIPRMLGSINKKTVCDAFVDMRIGTVTELDMVYKINEKSNSYYFAFIKINPYNTPQSCAMQSNLEQNKYIRLTYDEEAGQYWEIKKYVPRAERGLPEKNEMVQPGIEYNGTHSPRAYYNLWDDAYSICSPILPIIDSITNTFNQRASVFTAQDKVDLLEEYEDLEREIYIHISSI